ERGVAPRVTSGPSVARDLGALPRGASRQRREVALPWRVGRRPFETTCDPLPVRRLQRPVLALRDDRTGRPDKSAVRAILMPERLADEAPPQRLPTLLHEDPD